MARYRMPEHIVRHSEAVCAVALHLTRRLNAEGRELSEPLVLASALLHDIAKLHCLNRRLDHALTGAKLLRKLGYPEIASVVRQHVRLSGSRPPGRVAEAEIVHYADKRVVDDRIATLSERLDYIRRRYCRTPEALVWLEKWSASAYRLEQDIFDLLPGSPNNLATLCMK
ncbi:MAG: HDIG domain-containing protein [Proteobacteria bacterium]|nr:HDIG domain-containing protein [Pseudomonadota bacterium]